MVQALTRVLLLVVATAAPAVADGLPAHPPSPPPRPTFPGDPPPGALPPEAAETAPTDAAPAEAAPAQAYAPVDVPVPPQARIDVPQPPYDPVPRDADPDGFAVAEKAGLADLTRKYAARHGVPLALLHRIIMRESKYHPTAINRRYYGLMQITQATAKGMGYKGPAKGLLDAETNLAYATPYLANAWALSDGDMNRAVKLYAAGYYYTAKSRGMLSEMRSASSPPVKAEAPAPQPTLAAPPPAQTGFFDSLFNR